MDNNRPNQYSPPKAYSVMHQHQAQAGYPPIPPGPDQHIPYPPGPNIQVVIFQQPAPGGGYSMPQSHFIPNCPPGLEYLASVDQLLVFQKVELLEVFTSFETKNKYLIANTLGQKIFFAAEESGCLSRNCCDNIRPFDMKIVDNFGQQVINLNRPLNCECCCFPCCLQKMEVTAPPGTIIGFIEQTWTIFTPSFVVKNAAGDIIFKIKGACCDCSCCSDVNFKVYSSDGETEVGNITKKFSGIIKESFTDADNFGITFPRDLDVKMKATLLGALFLIDFMYYENNQQ